MTLVPFRAPATFKTIAGIDGRFLRPGDFMESLGYGRRILDLGFLDVTHPDDHGISRAVHGWLLEGHTRLIVSKRYLARDGRVVPATMHIEVVHDARGRPRYMRAWLARQDQGWGAASAVPRVRAFADACHVREGFVAEPVERDPAGRAPRAHRVGRLVLPPELV